MKNKEKKTSRQIVFSETVDSAITGYAIGVSFSGIGIFLLLNPDYFSVRIISYIVGAAIGFLGVLGVGVELSKSSRIKGLGYLVTGALLLVVWLWGYLRVHALWLNVLLFLLLVVGCYAMCLGLFQGAYSILHNLRERNREESSTKTEVIGSAITQIVLFLTQLCGLALAIINVVKTATT